MTQATAMVVNLNNSLARIRIGILLLAMVFALPACTPTAPRGGTFRDDLANWGETNKRPGAPGLIWGASDQARQVEKNLGVQ